MRHSEVSLLQFSWFYRSPEQRLGLPVSQIVIATYELVDFPIRRSLSNFRRILVHGFQIFHEHLVRKCAKKKAAGRQLGFSS